MNLRVLNLLRVTQQLSSVTGLLLIDSQLNIDLGGFVLTLVLVYRVSTKCSLCNRSPISLYRPAANAVPRMHECSRVPNMRNTIQWQMWAFSVTTWSI